MTYISDFYEEVESERHADRGEHSYLLIARSPSNDDSTLYVRNQQTGVLLAITKTSMAAVGTMADTGDPILERSS